MDLNLCNPNPTTSSHCFWWQRLSSSLCCRYCTQAKTAAGMNQYSTAPVVLRYMAVDFVEMKLSNVHLQFGEILKVILHVDATVAEQLIAQWTYMSKGVVFSQHLPTKGVLITRLLCCWAPVQDFRVDYRPHCRVIDLQASCEVFLTGQLMLIHLHWRRPQSLLSGCRNSPVLLQQCAH